MSMFSGGIKAKGLNNTIKRFQGIEERSYIALAKSIDESLELVEAAAKHILMSEVYDKQREPYDEAPNPHDKDSLYNSFVTEIIGEGKGYLSGLFSNVSPHAIFLEDGTDNEGTGYHRVPFAGTFALMKWINPQTGEIAFSKGHLIKGVTPIRFMERALQNHKVQVREIFRKNFAAVLDGS